MQRRTAIALIIGLAAAVAAVLYAGAGAVAQSLDDLQLYLRSPELQALQPIPQTGCDEQGRTDRDKRRASCAVFR